MSETRSRTATFHLWLMVVTMAAACGDSGPGSPAVSDSVAPVSVQFDGQPTDAGQSARSTVAAQTGVTADATGRPRITKVAGNARKRPSVDLNGDGVGDLVWRGPDGTVGVWMLSGGGIASASTLGTVGANWQLVESAGDFNGDGHTDLLWRSDLGDLFLWTMHAGRVVSRDFVATVPLAYTLVSGAGDFDGDGRSDLLWRGPGGEVLVWLMNGPRMAGGDLVLSISLGWSILKGSGDYDGDGRSDLLWRGPAGEVGVWLMNGASIRQARLLGKLDGQWRLADAAGDYNGDGTSDLLWRNRQGDVGIWTMSGGAIAVADFVGRGVPDAWQIVEGTGDLDGDGRSDVLWRNGDGTLGAWYLNGTAMTRAAMMQQVSPQWALLNNGGVAVMVDARQAVPACTPGLIRGYKGTIDDAPMLVRGTPESGEVGGPGLTGAGVQGTGIIAGDAQLYDVTVTVDLDDGRSWSVDADDGTATFVSCGHRGTGLATVRARTGSEYFDPGSGQRRPLPTGFVGRVAVSPSAPDSAGGSATLAFDANIGVTTFTEAAVRHLEDQSMSVGGGVALVSGGTPWADPAQVRAANKLISDAVADGLPGIYRTADGANAARSLDVTRAPKLLSEINAGMPGTLPNSNGGVYGAVLGGLARTGAVMLPSSATPALEMRRLVADDLADGKFDARRGGVQLPEVADLINLYRIMPTVHAVQIGGIIEAAGTSALKARVSNLGYYHMNIGATTCCTVFYLVLGTDGIVRSRIELYQGGPGPVIARKTISDIRLSELVGDVGVSADRKTIYRFGMDPADRSKVTFQSIFALPAGSGLTVTSAAGDALVRLSDGSFRAGAQSVQVPAGVAHVVREVIPLTCSPACPNRYFGLRVDGRVVQWPIDGSGAPVLLNVDNVIALASETAFGVFGLTRDGDVYWLNADRAIRLDYLNPSLDASKPFTNTAAAPRLVTGLPKICAIVESYAVACGSGEIWSFAPRLAMDHNSNRIGIFYLDPVAKLTLSEPVWRITRRPPYPNTESVNYWGAAFLSVSGQFDVASELSSSGVGTTPIQYVVPLDPP
jgi:hypothetical protein